MTHKNIGVSRAVVACSRIATMIVRNIFNQQRSHPNVLRFISSGLLARGLLLIALLPVGMLFAAAAVQAQDYEKGLTAFNQAEYAEAETQWLPLARTGELRSQYALAVLYEKRAARDPELITEAAFWYEQAAKRGHPGAQTNYASLLATGRGVERDPRGAVDYWEMAARQDNALAQYNLGLAYYRGEGVIPDAKSALAWFRRAADAGMSDAQFALGQMHALGVGTARNKGRALTWFAKAEAQGNNDAGRQADRLRDDGVRPEPPGPAAPLPAPFAAGETSGEDAADLTAQSTGAGSTPPSSVEKPAPSVAALPDTSEKETPASSGDNNEPLVWLGSFGSAAAAEDFRDKTLALGDPFLGSYPLQINEAGQERFRVLLAGPADAKEAEAFCQSLKSRIPTAFCAVLEP